MARFLAVVALVAVASCSAEEMRAKRQWFGGFGAWGAAVAPAAVAVHQPIVQTASVQQPVVTQVVKQPVFQTTIGAPIIQQHTSVVEQPVYKHIAHAVAVPTPVLEQVVVTPKIVQLPPTNTKISVIQRAKRQWFGGFGAWGATAVPVANVVAPAIHQHTNIVNPPVVQTVVQPEVHTQVINPVVNTYSTVVKPVVHEIHHNIPVATPVVVRPQIIEPEVIVPQPSNTKISVIQRA